MSPPLTSITNYVDKTALGVFPLFSDQAGTSDNVRMIFPRLVMIALRRYTVEPNNRPPAVRMLLRNALRLAIAHLGQGEAASIVADTLAEKTGGAG